MPDYEDPKSYDPSPLIYCGLPHYKKHNTTDLFPVFEEYSFLR